jgi:MFS transporter, PCFT/HCP family, solute carrier family 46 (folate transporter), member 1
MLTRVGRRLVFALSLAGMVFGGLYNFAVMSLWKVLPLQLIWASPVFLLIGGGEAVTAMMFYAIGNDLTTEENR